MLHDGDECRPYVSGEIAGTSVRRIDMLRASRAADFAAQGRRTVLDLVDFGLP